MAHKMQNSVLSMAMLRSREINSKVHVTKSSPQPRLRHWLTDIIRELQNRTEPAQSRDLSHNPRSLHWTRAVQRLITQSKLIALNPHSPEIYHTIHAHCTEPMQSRDLSHNPSSLHWTRAVQRSIKQSMLTALNPCSPETYHTIQAHCTEPAQSRDLSHNPRSLHWTRAVQRSITQSTLTALNPCSPEIYHTIHAHCTEPAQSRDLSHNPHSLHWTRAVQRSITQSTLTALNPRSPEIYHTIHAHCTEPAQSRDLSHNPRSLHWTRAVQRSITQSTLTALNPRSPEIYHTIHAHCTEPAQSRDLSHNPSSLHWTRTVQRSITHPRSLHWTRAVQRSITQSTLTALNPCSPEIYHTIHAHCTEPAQSRDLSHNPHSPDLSHIHAHCTEPAHSRNLSDVHAHQIYHTIHAQSCFYVYSTHNTKTLLASESEHKGCCVPSDSSCWIDWLNELRFHILLDAKQVILKTVPKPISWHGLEKLSLTQQQHTFSNQKKCTTTQNKYRKKTKARFSCLLRHSAWQRTRPILILAIHKFVIYSLRHPLT